MFFYNPGPSLFLLGQAFYEDDIDGFKAALGRPRQFDVRRQLPSGASLLDLARQMSSSCSQFLMTREKYSWLGLDFDHLF